MVDKKLVFIGGFPSGGTDLTKNILNAHSEIFISGEMPFLYNIEDQFPFASNDIYNRKEAYEIFQWMVEYDIWNNLLNKTRFRDITFDQENEYVSKYDFFYHFFSDKKGLVWGNKTPQNSENTNKLLKLFPESKLIIVTRDVRDVVLSWNKKWGKNPYLVADKWNRRMSFVCEMAKKDDRIILIKFEDILSKTEIVTKNICGFIGIDWDENMLNYHEYIHQPVDGKINYGKPIKKENKQKWRDKASSAFIRRVEEIAFKGMQKLKYEIAYAKEEKALSSFYKKVGIIHDALAMLFVGNRVKENNSLIDRFAEVKKQIKLKTS